MNAAQTRDVARAYFEAWSTRQGPDVLRQYMHEDFVFRAGELTVVGREQFLSFGGWPQQAVTTLVADAYDDGTAIQVYEAVNGDARVKIADHLTVQEGLVVSSDTICDGATFQAFMAAGRTEAVGGDDDARGQLERPKTRSALPARKSARASSSRPNSSSRASARSAVIIG